LCGGFTGLPAPLHFIHHCLIFLLSYYKLTEVEVDAELH
jgi:hypothetical protein